MSNLVITKLTISTDKSEARKFVVNYVGSEKCGAMHFDAEGHLYDCFSVDGQWVVCSATTRRPLAVVSTFQGLDQWLRKTHLGAKVVCA